MTNKQHFDRKMLTQMSTQPTPEIHSIPTCHENINIFIRDPKWSEIRQLKTRAIGLADIPKENRRISMVDYYLWVIQMLAVDGNEKDILLTDDDLGYLYFATDTEQLFPLLQNVDDVLENLLGMGDEELSGSDNDEETPHPKS